MTVVVTGASGFLGRALVAELVRAGVSTIAVSRRGAVIPGATCMSVHDYGETPCPTGAALVHLAEEAVISTAAAQGEAHVAHVRERAGALAAMGFSRIVYASSAEVHRAGPDAGDPYVRGKRAAEAAIAEAGGVILRLANVYGPGMKPNTLISDILRQIPGEGPLYLRNTAPRRDLLWIDDAAAGLAAAALGRSIGLFDLGSGDTVAVIDIARMALAAAGEAARPVLSLNPPTADDDVFLEIAPMERHFGWRPQVPLAAGMARLVRGTV